MTVAGWTHERVEALKALWADGLSTGQIAAKLGLTRSAVGGKIHRLKLPGRPTPIKQASPRPKPSWDSRPARAPMPLPAADDVPTVSMDGLEAGHCRWPCADVSVISTGGLLFFGRPRTPGLPYCDGHARRAYALPRPVAPRPGPSLTLAVALEARTLAPVPAPSSA